MVFRNSRTRGAPLVNLLLRLDRGADPNLASASADP